MWRRVRLTEVPADTSVVELIERLGGYDVVVVDVDDTLVPDGASGPRLSARVAEAAEAALRAGVGRLVVVSNDSGDRAPEVEGVVWRVNKPWTRRARLGIAPADRVAVVGDRMPDGFLAWRWGVDFYRAAGSRRRSWPRWLFITEPLNGT